LPEVSKVIRAKVSRSEGGRSSRLPGHDRQASAVFSANEETDQTALENLTKKIRKKDAKKEAEPQVDFATHSSVVPLIWGRKPERKAGGGDRKKEAPS